MPWQMRRVGTLWVNRVFPTVRRSLPVYPDKQTFSEPVGMSQTCQEETEGSVRVGVRLKLRELARLNRLRYWSR